MQIHASTIDDRPLPVPFAFEYIVQACEALDEAHRAGIVHRGRQAVRCARPTVFRSAAWAPRFRVDLFKRMIPALIEVPRVPRGTVGAMFGDVVSELAACSARAA
jgi:hypothetical protein